MWKLAVVVGLVWGMATVAFANPIEEAGEVVAETTVQGARWTGHTVGAGVTWVLVNTDNALHWTNLVLHNRVIHPLVELITLGSVQLSGS